MFGESTFSETAFSAVLPASWGSVNDSSSVVWSEIPDVGAIWTPVSTNTTPWSPVVI